MRTSLAPCPDYAPDHVAAAVAAAVAPFGGWSAVLPRPGARVLVKVNMLSDHPPEDAVTTHPEVLRAVLRGLLAAGAKPFVGDSPASAVSLPRIWERTGIRAVCEAEGVPLVPFEGEGARLRERDGYRFLLTAALDSADAIVNLPKVKTHALMTFTCAVKNLYGLVPGYQKAALHKRYPRPKAFAGLLRAIEAEERPALSLADGIVGMEGEGPSAGSPCALGFLAASPDAYALDRDLALLLGIPLRSIPYLSHLVGSASTLEVHGPEAPRVEVAGHRPATRPLVGSASTLEVHGPEAPRVEVAGHRPAIRLPRTARTRLIPTALVHALSPLIWVRPSIAPSRCVRCGRCVASCPVKTLVMDKPAPRLSCPRACIGCCCCHEMCPAKAIEMRQSPLLRLYGAFRDLR